MDRQTQQDSVSRVFHHLQRSLLVLHMDLNPNQFDEMRHSRYNERLEKTESIISSINEKYYFSTRPRVYDIGIAREWCTHTGLFLSTNKKFDASAACCIDIRRLVRVNFGVINCDTDAIQKTIRKPSSDK